MRSSKKKSVIFANFVLGSIIAISILAIAYLFYKSNASQIPLSLKLVVLFIAGLLFSIFTLFMRNSWKINIAVFIFSLLIAAYGVEFVLFAQHRITFPNTKIDTRNKLEVLSDLRAEGIDAWPQIVSWLFVKNNGIMSGDNRMFPLGGISDKMIVYCNESGQYKIFESDEHGFNNPKSQYGKGNIKTVLVGDSFAIGSCVKSEEEIASRLRNIGISSLNLGNGGNGPLIELAVLKEYAEPIQPEIVLWIYFEGNDLSDLKGERTSSMLMSYLDDNYSQNLLERQVEIDTTLIKYVNSQWIKETKLPHMRHWINNMPLMEREEKKRENRLKPLKLWHLRDRIGLINKPQKPKREVTFRTQLRLFSQVIATAYKRTSRWKGKFYFVYLPEMERYVGNNDDGSFFDRDDVLDIVHKIGIPVIDFHEVLKKHPDPLSLVPFLGAHYNAEGYKLVSELIVNRLKEDGLLAENDG
jgi:hypothetical protein